LTYSCDIGNKNCTIKQLRENEVAYVIAHLYDHAAEKHKAGYQGW